MSIDDGNSLTISHPTLSICFFGRQGDEIGRLFEKDGRLFFEGDVDASAKAFFDRVIDIHEGFSKRLEELEAKQ